MAVADTDPTYYEEENSTNSTYVENYIHPSNISTHPSNVIHPAVLWAKIISFAIIITLTVVGNSIVVIIILRNKHMRTVTYYYLMNLAVADIAIAVFSEWIWLHNHLLGSWIFGEVICKFSTYFQGKWCLHLASSLRVNEDFLTVISGVLKEQLD